VGVIDGIESEPTVVRVVTPPVAPRTLDLRANALLVDPTRGRIWASIPSTNPGGNTVAELNPVTGTVVSRIQVGSEPGPMALSDDGTALFVGLSGANGFKRIDLTTRTVGQMVSLTLPFEDQAYATDIGVQPGSNTTIAVTTGSHSSTGTYGPAIYDGEVRRPNMLGVYQGTELAWTSPSRLISYNGSHTGSELYEVRVDANGATITDEVREGLSAFSTELVFVGSRLYGSDGSVVSPTSLQQLGHFQFPDSFSRAFGPAVDTSNNRAYFVQFLNNGALISAYNTTTFALVASTRVENVISGGGLGFSNTDLVLWAPDKLAFQFGDRIYFIDDAPG
jgi:DNA-binding beta-propeller fold protein YncE